jgi:hypothetical protein
MEDYSNFKKELDEMFQSVFFLRKEVWEISMDGEMHIYWYEMGSPSF